VPFYGLAVMCVDHPEVQSLIGRIRDRRIQTYGFSALADLRADNVEVVDGGSQFDAVILERDGSRRSIEGIRLPMPGRHNVLNALAAIAVGMELGMDDAAIARGFEKFDGVKRRFTRVGEVDGAVVIDD
jgi:UDP-N-acetylmuramate--alanine ligase